LQLCSRGTLWHEQQEMGGKLPLELVSSSSNSSSSSSSSSSDSSGSSSSDSSGSSRFHQQQGLLPCDITGCR
jgi:hypothetical protein